MRRVILEFFVCLLGLLYCSVLCSPVSCQILSLFLFKICKLESWLCFCSKFELHIHSLIRMTPVSHPPFPPTIKSIICEFDHSILKAINVCRQRVGKE